MPCWIWVTAWRSGASFIWPTLSREEPFGYLQEVQVDLLDLDRLLQRHAGHLGAVDRRHLAEFARFHHLVGVGAEARGEDPVGRGRGAAALDVAEDGDPGLVAGAALQLHRQRRADPAQPGIAVFVAVLYRLDQPFLAALEGQLGSLGDDDDREVLAAVVAAGDVVADLLYG